MNVHLYQIYIKIPQKHYFINVKINKNKWKLWTRNFDIQTDDY